MICIQRKVKLSKNLLMVNPCCHTFKQQTKYSFKIFKQVKYASYQKTDVAKQVTRLVKSLMNAVSPQLSCILKRAGHFLIGPIHSLPRLVWFPLDWSELVRFVLGWFRFVWFVCNWCKILAVLAKYSGKIHQCALQFRLLFGEFGSLDAHGVILFQAGYDKCKHQVTLCTRIAHEIFKIFAATYQSLFETRN